MNIFLKYTTLCSFLMLAGISKANNITVSNVSLSGRDVSAGTNNSANFNLINFSVAWDNSWRWNSSSGSISNIGIITGGSGYTTAPTVSITGGGGSGATATATISGGVVTGISITSAGSGYTSIPTVSFSGGSGSGASAEAYIQSWWDAAWVFAKFRVGASNAVRNNVSSSGTTVTVLSTANLRVGMPVVKNSGTGTLAANTVISSITSSTQFELNNTPTVALSGATIECVRIWEHAWLNNSGHTAPSGSSMDIGLLTPGSSFNASTNPGLGAFIYRSSAGSGSNTFSNAQLRWNYGAQGVPDNAMVDIQVFGVEMVLVPQGSFYLGDGNSTALAQFSAANALTTPFEISSESQITLGGTSASNLGLNTAPGFRDNGQSEDFSSGTTQTLPNAYPKGFNAFYCMKYETTQGQYRDFLNTLTYNQQASRTVVVPTSSAGTGALINPNNNRNGLDVQVAGNATTLVPAVYGSNLDGDANYNESVDGGWIACNYLSWGDVTSYWDWSGIRPMTELEFEKACRGIVSPVSGEYAWGDINITFGSGPTNSGTASEVSSTSGSNCNANATISGPIRAGSFAQSSSGRREAGASYYGIMDLSGNVWERVVTVGDATGRSFTGLHGNGMLGATGDHDVTNWPGQVGSGSGFRGGRYTNTTMLQVSDRTRAVDGRTNRVLDWSGRGVRTAP